MERFKRIKGFERYVIGDCGTVKNIVTGKILSQREATNGYLRVNLRKGDVRYEKPKVMSVHRLVAEAYIPNPDGLKTVNHKDGNKKNNHVSNLEWMTTEDNLRHAWENGLMHEKGKEFRNRRRHRLDPEEIRRRNIESHSSESYRIKMQKINEEHGITRPVIQMDILSGKVIGVYNNCHEAAKSMFGDKYENKDRLISRCARGKCKTAYGYNWNYQIGGDNNEPGYTETFREV